MGSLPEEGVSAGEDDKENAQSGAAAAAAGVVVGCGGELGDGVSGSSCVGDKGPKGRHVSGQKRGGGDIEIMKQQSFTGSYFQVRRAALSTWFCWFNR